MNLDIKKLSGLILAMLLLCSSAFADGQFYFVGKYGPKGATSVTGQAEYGVFLRWDVLDSNLPNDIESIELRKQGESGYLLKFSPGEFQSEHVIYSEIFGASHQQQRLLSQITQLKEDALAKPQLESQNQDFSTDAFAGHILQRLENSFDTTEQDALWRYLGSRVNFNLARAANRAYLDESASGTETYTLVAMNEQGQERVLGKVTVDASPGAEHLTQVLPAINFGQQIYKGCDPLGLSAEHATIKLTWLPGGSTVTEKVANDIALIGYDIYRTIENITGLTQADFDRDIATLARAAQHNGRGEVVIPGLEKVNKSLIMIKGGESENDSYEWLETPQQLKDSGLLPGQGRAYYLVPVDFAGHYGPSVVAYVEVPDIKKPKTPWDVQSYIDTPTDSAALYWSQVSVENYLASFSSSRKICNADTAIASSTVEWVPNDKSCESDVRLTERLDAIGYRVYRFTNFGDAQFFQDSDGDGVADSIEGDSAKCDPSQVNFPDESKLVGFDITDFHTDDTEVVFHDANVDVAKAYWYRVAAVSGSSVSELSVPIQMVMPERTLPGSPELDIRRRCRPDSVTYLDKEQCAAKALDGDTFESFEINITAQPGECIELTMYIDGDPARVASSCGSNDPENLSYIHERGVFCGAATAVDANNNHSASAIVPCLNVPDTNPPLPPQLRTFSVEESIANISWKLPLTPIASVLIELEHKGSGTEIFYKAANDVNPGEQQAISRELIELIGSNDEWCVRLQSVGVTAPGQQPLVSAWSARKCQIRRAAGYPNPDYLTWPQQSAIEIDQTTLVARNAQSLVSGAGTLDQLFLLVDLASVAEEITGCKMDDSASDTYPENRPVFATVQCDQFNQSGYNEVNVKYASYLPMMVYRQAVVDGQTGPWVQVSPLLETVHWDRVQSDKDDEFRLNDPYFGMYRIEGNNGWRLAFIDRYPHINGYQYRYQFVVFTNNHTVEKSFFSGLVTAAQ